MWAVSMVYVAAKQIAPERDPAINSVLPFHFSLPHSLGRKLLLYCSSLPYIFYEQWSNALNSGNVFFCTSEPVINFTAS